MYSLSTDPRLRALSYRYEAESRELPQSRVPLVHSLHGGVYTRTAKIPAGVTITSVLIKIPTTVILMGRLAVLSSDAAWAEFSGTHVLAGLAGRRQVMHAIEDTVVVMLFPTRATTVAEAEAEFTDEAALLQSAGGVGDIIINTHQENPCQQSEQAPLF